MTKAWVETRSGTPTLMIDGAPYLGTAMTVASSREGISKVDAAYYKKLGEAGVRVFFLICDTDWTGTNGYAKFRNEAEILLKNVPDAYIIPRVGLQPSVAWTEAHPEAMIAFSDNVPRKTFLRSETYNAEMGAYSLHASAWREDSGKALLDFCEKAEGEAFGDRIIGYFPAAGSTSEWLPSMSLPLNYKEAAYYDVSEGFRAEFKQYCKAHGTDAPAVPDNTARYYILDFDRETAAQPAVRAHMPSPAAPGNGTQIGSFLDIEHHRDVLDFYMAWGEATANSILYFARLIKKHSPDKLVGAFYGYTRVVHQSGNFTGLGKILKSGVLDFCAAPGDYQNRQPGGWEAIRSVADTYKLYNMLFFAEDDTRTHLENSIYRSGYGVYNAEDTEAVMKRNFAKNLCGGNNAWWFDQHHGGGRYNDPLCFDLFRRQAEIAAAAAKKEMIKTNDIALVYDIESRIAASHDTSHCGVTLFKNFFLGQLGAPYDEYLADDLENEQMPDYKLYIFCADYCLDSRKREFIHKKLQKNHAAALWMYGAGFMKPDATEKLSCSNMQDLTGFATKMLCDVVYDQKFKICGTHPIAAKLQKNHVYGANYLMGSNHWKTSLENSAYLCPLFYIENEGSTVFAKFCEGGRPAAAIREYEGFTSVFCGAKYTEAVFVRAVAEYVGCHIYAHDGDVIYANSDYLAIHASSGGTKTLHLREKCSPYEVYEKEYYGTNSDTITFEMDEGRTKMFLLR